MYHLPTTHHYRIFHPETVKMMADTQGSTSPRAMSSIASAHRQGDAPEHPSRRKRDLLSVVEEGKIPRKKGEFVQHMGGGLHYGHNFSDALPEDPKKGLSFREITSPFSNYGMA
ncbi:TPA: hypothetical protein HA281_02510 [Candidatus Woesearchaeota archaeon]|nr:hypothetical protein [Candidatus Woesearchaeota archaeon]HIH91649.1 hypothetical protein [Candidatus Woesearchaeota archaeon]HII64805.1 hypothetical protein [Candidatus Woesearchaeota archaeon]HIJ18973.1 hypothetical protein [Candidatus Woesearchaeota archaeon]